MTPNGPAAGVRPDPSVAPRREHAEGEPERASETPEAERVLVAAEDVRIHRLVERTLRGQGKAILWALSGPQAVRMVRKHRPSLLLLDVALPGDHDYELCRWLRADWRYGQPSILMLVPEAFSGDRALAAGADDYILKPLDPVELVSRVRAVLRRGEQIRSSSPLTSLPGNVHIERELRRRVAVGEKFALLYVDLDDFKAYNDHCGFLRGDRALRTLGEVLRSATERRPGTFLGHVGGDDFVILADLDVAAGIVLDVVTGFRARVPGLYEPRDAGRGWIEIEDRQGKRRRFGLLTLSVGVASNLEGDLDDHRVLVDVATDMKEQAKRLQGNAVAVDRRAGADLQAILGGAVSVLDAEVRRRRPGARAPFSLRRLVLRPAAALLAASLVVGPSGAAMAENARPGELLWPAKLAVEEIRLVLAGDEERRLALHLEFAARRLREIPPLLEDGADADALARVTDNLRWHTAEAVRTVTASGEVHGVGALRGEVEVAVERQVGFFSDAASAVCGGTLRRAAEACGDLRRAYAVSLSALGLVEPPPGGSSAGARGRPETPGRGHRRPGPPGDRPGRGPDGERDGHGKGRGRGRQEAPGRERTSDGQGDVASSSRGRGRA